MLKCQNWNNTSWILTPNIGPNTTKNAKMYPITSHYPHEPWLSKSFNTQSNSLTQVRYQGSIMASSRKHEDMQWKPMENEYHWLIAFSMYKVIHEKYDDLLDGHDNVNAILKFSPIRVSTYVRALFSHREILPYSNNKPQKLLLACKEMMTTTKATSTKIQGIEATPSQDHGDHCSPCPFHRCTWVNFDISIISITPTNHKYDVASPLKTHAYLVMHSTLVNQLQNHATSCIIMDL